MAYQVAETVRGRPHESWVLVVEDESDVLQTLLQGLSKRGYRVVHAQTSHDAVTKLMNQRFDCIMLDLRLVKGSGEEVLEHLAVNRDNVHTPVLVMSGFLDAHAVKRLRGRVQDILVKPFHLGTLVSKLESLLSQA